MQTEIKVLLALSDRNLSLQIIEKFKNKYPNCPIAFDTSEDGGRAVDEIRLYKHALVLMDYHLPTLSGHELVTEILKAFSDCEIIAFASETEKVDVGLIKVQLPILDWDKLLWQITQCLPLDFQIQHSLISNNSELHTELVNLAKKYQNHNMVEVLKIKSWIYDHDTAIAKHNSAESTISTNEAVNLTPVDLSKFIWSEVLIIGLLIFGLVAEQYLAEEGSFLKAGIEISLASLLLINGLGFIFLRFISRASNK
jgi:CheY-like chemotaxis protein